MELDELTKTAPALILLSSDQLEDFAAVCVARALNATPTKPVEPEIEKPISQPEAVAFLGKSRQTLIKWRKAGVITAYTLGGRVYYKKSDLLKALQAH